MGWVDALTKKAARSWDRGRGEMGAARWWGGCTEAPDATGAVGNSIVPALQTLGVNQRERRKLKSQERGLDKEQRLA